METLSKFIEITPNYPKKKIDFIDVTNLVTDPECNRLIKELLLDTYNDTICPFSQKINKATADPKEYDFIENMEDCGCGQFVHPGRCGCDRDREGYFEAMEKGLDGFIAYIKEEMERYSVRVSTGEFDIDRTKINEIIQKELITNTRKVIMENLDTLFKTFLKSKEPEYIDWSDDCYNDEERQNLNNGNRKWFIGYTKAMTKLFNKYKFVIEAKINCNNWEKMEIEGHYKAVVGLESRGYLFGMLAAQALGIGFIRMGKHTAKMPGICKFSKEFGTEYSKDQFKVRTKDIQAGERYLVIDDIGATGGSAEAACELINSLGAKCDIWCMVQVPELKESITKRLAEWNYRIVLPNLKIEKSSKNN